MSGSRTAWADDKPAKRDAGANNNRGGYKNKYRHQYPPVIMHEDAR